MRKAAIICALVAVAHYFAWALLEPKASAPAFNGILQSVSYTPFDGSAHPDSGKRTSPAQIRSDLTAIAPYTHAIRTYSSTGGSELIPGIAADLGLTTAAGAWIDRDRVRNEVEIETVIELANQHRSITSVVVGNETIYRADQTVAEIIEKIKRVKREVSVPVTTARSGTSGLSIPNSSRPWTTSQPTCCPTGKEISEQEAVAQALRIHQQLRAAYPKKRIVIAEFGWPSAGHNRRAANPGAIPQATVMREFLNAARRHKIEYNIIEAYDQPWKTFEGGVGPYWGLFDTTRQPKFSWSGPVSMPGYSQLVVIALAVGALLSAPILLIPGVTVAQGALMAVAANGFGAWVSYAFGFWRDHYFVTGAAIAFGIGMLLLLPLILTSLYKIEEIAALVLGRRPRRLLSEAVRFPAPCRWCRSTFRLPRAARNAEEDPQLGGRPRLPELRVHRRREQHARPRHVAAD